MNCELCTMFSCLTSIDLTIPLTNFAVEAKHGTLVFLRDPDLHAKGSRSTFRQLSFSSSECENVMQTSGQECIKLWSTSRQVSGKGWLGIAPITVHKKPHADMGIISKSEGQQSSYRVMCVLYTCAFDKERLEKRWSTTGPAHCDVVGHLCISGPRADLI